MASHSNKSPSPLSSKPTYHNPANSVNKSFVKPTLQSNPRRFGPFTPTNSPSDFPRRSLVGKESVGVGENDEKENEKDQNLRGSSKLKSPKVSKNFMSPTISAASKFTPSPKKKILVERNDPVRTSISLSDGKATFLSSINVSQELDSSSLLERNVSDVVEVPPIPKPPKTVTFSSFPSNSNPEPELSESVITDSGKDLKAESVLKNNLSSSSDSCSIAPLDADPYVPPYDPKTNYMSPRPKFLYYKPNSRVETLLQDGYLADIMSESFSENNERTGESQYDIADIVTEEGAEVSDNADMINEEAPMVNDNADMVNEEVSMIDDNADMVLGLEETMESFPGIQTDKVVQKRKTKLWGFSKLMFFSVVLMFLMACVLSVSLTRSGSLNRFVLSDLGNYYQELNIVDSAKAGYEMLAGHVNEFSSEMNNYYQESNVPASVELAFEMVFVHVNQFWDNTMDSISKLTKRLGDGKTLGPLKFVNLTYQETNIWDEGNFIDDHVISAKMIQEDAVGESSEDFEEDDMLEEFDSDEINEEEMVEFDEDELEEDDVDTETEVVSYEKEVDSQADMFESEAVSSDSVMDTELVSENSQDQFTGILQDQEIEVEAAKVDATPETTTVVERSTVDVTSVTKDSLSSFKSESATEKSESNSAYYTIVISSLFVALLPAIAFLHEKSKTSSAADVVVQQTHPSLSKQEKLISQNWQQKEVEESCRSEMSSFSSAFYSKKEELREDEMEAQSYEGKQRRYTKRESLASSTGSPSYGSFTTFERIPIKHGDDEIVTPVRRSSRIRKHAVTSP